jgi:hypothetical protein
MEVYPVSRRVNSPTVDLPELVEPLTFGTSASTSAN